MRNAKKKNTQGGRKHMHARIYNKLDIDMNVNTDIDMNMNMNMDMDTNMDMDYTRTPPGTPPPSASPVRQWRRRQSPLKMRGLPISVSPIRTDIITRNSKLSRVPKTAPILDAIADHVPEKITAKPSCVERSPVSSPSEDTDWTLLPSYLQSDDAS